MGKLQKITNNPLNVRWSEKNKWLGQIGRYKGFCKFSNEFWGIRAAAVILINYMKRGKYTIRDMITTYAPPNENNTEAYVKQVAKHCYLKPEEGLHYDLEFHDMLVEMYMIESGVKESEVPDDLIWQVIGWLSPNLEQMGLRFTRFLDKPVGVKRS